MPRHPFASVQYFRNSLSTGTLNWSPGKTEKERARESEQIPPVPQVPAFLHRYNSVTVPLSPSSDETHTTKTTSSLHRRPLPKLPLRIPTPRTDTTSRTSSIIVNVGAADADGRPVPSAVASPGHYVKHSSKVTLVLGGQEDCGGQPTYSSESVIEGILAVPRPSGLFSIEIKVEGRVKLREVGGRGSFTAKVLDEVVYSWDMQQNMPFPSKVSFRYVLPTHYTDLARGERVRLPPSYEAHLQGIPGFHIGVAYGVTVYLRHTRDMSEWWRSGSRIRVPFRYRELNRPERAGPFPSNLAKTPKLPKTLFKASLRSRWRDQPDLDIHVFLPGSRVCSIKEPVSFFVTVFGDYESLEPFVLYQPIASSFHPMSDMHPLSPKHITSLSGLQAQFLKPRPSVPLPPVLVRLQRRTIVENSGSDHKLTATKVLAIGTIHSASKSSKSVTWSGTIVLPQHVQCGGFSASGLDVVDSIVLTIVQPDAPRSRFLPFSESIPIRLTSETHDCHSAHPVSDWES